MPWIPACPSDTLNHGAFVLFTTPEGDELLIARTDEGLHCVINECSHDRRGFSGGCIEAGLLVCPRHGARFCLRTGKALTPPAYEDLECFEVKEEEGQIWVKLED